MNSPRSRLRITAFLIIFTFILFHPDGKPVAAQVSGSWETPQWIPGLVDSSPSQYPVMFADSSGKIHVFHSQFVGEQFGIVYTQWVEGVGWLKPVDIVLLPGDNEARLCGAMLDNRGMINLMYWGGTEIRSDIFFTQAPAQLAYKASAWSTPQMIGTIANNLTSAALTGDQDGFLMAVYSGRVDGHGLYSTYSEDWGKTWTRPEPLFLARSTAVWPSALQLYTPDNQTTHAVWGLGDEGGNSLHVSYAKFDQDIKSWSKVAVIDEAIEFEADTPSIIKYGDSLFMIYHNGFPTTRWMVQSRDNGDTWSSPVRLFEHVGSNGAAALITDSSGQLHMFFGNRIGSPAIHGLWHCLWMNNAWSAPEAIMSGPQINGGDNGEEGFDPSFAQAVISRGNLLFIAWRHDPIAGPTHIWYSFRFLNTPQLPAVPVPTVYVSPTPTSLFAGIETQTPESILPTRLPEVTVPPTSTDPNLILLAGIIPAILLIAAILIFRRHK